MDTHPIARHGRSAALLLALLALGLGASTALATDYPLSDASLRIRRLPSGDERLVFASRDAAVPVVALGGPSDPSVVGALVEVVASGDPSVGAFVVPSGVAPRAADPGWRLTSLASGSPTYRFTNRAAPAAPSVVRTLLLRQGRRLEVVAHQAGLALTGDQGVVSVRVTIGSDRICARFDAATLNRDDPDEFRARGTPVSVLADCSDATLGTAAFLAPGIFGASCDDQHTLPPPDPPAATPAAGKLHRVTLDDPLAVCNDGTPAVLFVRKADAAAANAHDWVIWLAGGGQCGRAAECADRWCDRQQGPYSALIMSARFEEWTKSQQGIFSRGAGNRFGDFNHVIVPYCSSDAWIGTRTLDTEPAQSLFSGESYPGYRIAFHGRYIVDAAIAALRAGVTSDDGEETLEPLTAAESVVLSGSSAGGFGAIQNANRVAALIRERRPAIDVQLVADAINRPYQEDAARGVTATTVNLGQQIAAAVHAFHGGLVDDACLTAHPLDPLVCTQAMHVFVHHVGLRSFAQMDLEDITIGPWAYADHADFGMASRELLEGLVIGTTSFPEPIAVQQLGLFAPRCCHHVTLSSPDFYDLVVPRGGANLNDTLWDWWNASAVPVLIDDGTSTGSGCSAGPNPGPNPCAP